MRDLEIELGEKERIDGFQVSVATIPGRVSEYSNSNVIDVALVGSRYIVGYRLLQLIGNRVRLRLRGGQSRHFDTATTTLPSRTADHRPFCNCAIMRSMSRAELPVAFVRRSSSMLRSFAFSASSPAFETMPHLIHISARSATVRFVHFGMKSEATFGLPAPRLSLKNGYSS